MNMFQHDKQNNVSYISPKKIKVQKPQREDWGKEKILLRLSMQNSSPKYLIKLITMATVDNFELICLPTIRGIQLKYAGNNYFLRLWLINYYLQGSQSTQTSHVVYLKRCLQSCLNLIAPF